MAELQTIDELFTWLGLAAPPSPLAADQVLASWQARLAASRTDFLAHLMRGGLVALKDRQAVANGLARAGREGRLTPPPPPPPPKPLPPLIRVPARKPGPRRRILCLHGGGSSGDILNVQLATFRHELGDEYEFVFAQGPAWKELEPDSNSAMMMEMFFEGLPVMLPVLLPVLPHCFLLLLLLPPLLLPMLLFVWCGASCPRLGIGRSTSTYLLCRTCMLCLCSHWLIVGVRTQVNFCF